MCVFVHALWWILVWLFMKVSMVLSLPPETDFMKSEVSFSIIFNLPNFRNAVKVVLWVGWFDEFQYWFIENTMVLKHVLEFFCSKQALDFYTVFFPLLASIQSSPVNQAECFLLFSDKKCTSIHCFHAISYLSMVKRGKSETIYRLPPGKIGFYNMKLECFWE